MDECKPKSDQGGDKKGKFGDVKEQKHGEVKNLRKHNKGIGMKN